MEDWEMAAEEELEHDWIQHLLEEEGGQMMLEDEVVPEVLAELNKPPTSNKPGVQFKSKQLARNPTPAEFAQELQKARKAMLGRDGANSSTVHTALNVTDMLTQRQHDVARVDAEAFLHKYCEEPSVMHIPCILTNGSRFYLRTRRQPDSVVVGSERKGLAAMGSRLIEVSSPSSSVPNLLSNSMHELQKEADRIQTEVLADRKLREEAQRNSELYGTNQPAEDTGIESALRYSSVDGKGGGKSLWVEKYAPKSFTHLLSEEKLNREVLCALQAWSPYVFKASVGSGEPGPKKGDSLPSGAFRGGAAGAGGALSSKLDVVGIRSVNKDAPSSATKRTLSSSHGDGGGDGGGEASGEDGGDDEGKDDDNDRGGAGTAAKNDTRPFYKALLICGPPGTGKTTLAHVVARHCGYRPFEVNASDDRSHDVLKDALTRAMHGNTVTGDRLPNCIILDEIDGIDGKNSIDMLVKMIRTPLRTGKGTGGKAGSGKNVLTGTPITRPLICICNDQYAPSLRELRKFSRIFVFHPPSELRLVARLKAICASEKIFHVSPQSLTALASATGNDIRSAINTLQFAALRTSAATAALTHNNTAPKGPTSTFGSMLSSMISSGLKDVNRDAFQVWREIFSVREMSLANAKKKRISTNNKLPPGTQTGLLASTTTNSKGGGSTPFTLCGPSDAAMQSMADFGDSHLIMGGIFHNLLAIRYNDPSLTRTHLASDWISAVDQFDCFASGAGGNSGFGGGNSDGVSYQLMPYISSVAGAIHLYCSADEKVKIAWPSAEKDAHFKRKGKNNILETLINGSELGASCMRTKTIVVLDVLSFLVDITTPKARPVSLLTLTQSEQELLADCVKVMASVGLSYNTAAPTVVGSSYVGPNSFFSLEPAITELLSFTQCSDLKNRFVVCQRRAQVFCSNRKC